MQNQKEILWVAASGGRIFLFPNGMKVAENPEGLLFCCPKCGGKWQNAYIDK